MKRIHSMPTSEVEKKQWLENFKTNLPNFARSLQLDPVLVQRIDDGLTKSITHIQDLYLNEVEKNSLLEAREEHREVFFPELSDFIQAAKANIFYSRALGETMNVETYVSVKTNKDTSDASQLSVKITTSAQRVEFKFKRPAKNLVRIFSRRGNETDFTPLTTISTSEYIDNRPNLNQSTAEKREYYFVLSKNDKDGDRTNTYAVAVLM